VTTEGPREVPPAQRIPTDAELRTGPAIGEPFPDFSLRNQRGQLVNFEAARAGREPLLVFHRSARWCAFCRTQLDDLERARPEFEAAGVWLAAISNDPVGDLAQFADEHGTAFELLSDEGSGLIRQLGILNTLVPPSDPLHGIAFPGVYVVAADGTVRRKYFHHHFPVREAPSFLLWDAFGVRTGDPDRPSEVAAAPGLALRAVLDAPDVKPQQRVFLVVSLELEAGWELTATPVLELEPSDDVVVQAEAWVEPGVLRVELLSDARDVEAAPIDITASCELRGPGGEHVARRLELRLALPVGDLNRAARA